MDKTIGRYKILRELGKGGMGIIYKGLNPQEQKTVAIKVLPSAMVDRTTVERFNREARILTRLKHPHVIEVYDYGMDSGQHYLVMEYIEGEDLKTRIKRKGNLPIPECLQIASQIASALAYTHKEGVIHRDIKPSNIMFDHEGRVKMLDFGLVKILGITNVTMEGTSLGTPEYMSPEQVSDEGVDLRTDIYSLGVTMYEMLAGRPPFEGGNIQAVLMKHKFQEPVPLKQLRPQVPLELDMIVKKAMAKDVSQRYAHADDLLADIERLRGPNAAMVKVSAERKESRKTEPLPKVAERMAHTALSEKKDKRPASKIPLVSAVFIVLLMICLGYVFRDAIASLWQKGLPRRWIAQRQEKDLLKQTQETLVTFEQAEEHYRTGMQFFANNSVDPAIAEYKKAIALRPDYPLYYRDLALAYEKKKDQKNAVQAWRDLLRYDRTGSYKSLAEEKLRELGR